MRRCKWLNAVLFSLLAVLFLFSAFICVSPFISLDDGSFFKALADIVYRFADKYLGFFNLCSLSDYSLVPLAVLLCILTFDVAANLGFIPFLTKILLYPLTYLFLGGIGLTDSSWISSRLPENHIYFVIPLLAIGLFICLHSFLSAVSEVLKIDNRTKAPREKVRIKAINEKSKQLTPQQALQSLYDVKVPEFETYRNLPVYDDYIQDSSVDETAYEIAKGETPKKRAAKHVKPIDENETKKNAEKRESISKCFKPKAKKQLEDASQGDLFASFDNPEGFKFTPITQDVQAEEIPDAEVKDPADEKNAVIEEQDKISTAEEEYYDNQIEEEDIETAKENYNRISEGQDSPKKMSDDLISAVGGLKSAKDGAYLYDSSKLTYKFPPETLLMHYTQSVAQVADIDRDPDGRTIVETLFQFKIETKLVGIQHGPTFTLYELTLAKGVRVASVLSLADNIAMDLAVQSVRILAPIPGKSAIGIEVPNKKRDTIGFDLMLPALKSKDLRIPMVLGKTITGDSIVIDLAGTPHLLVAGTTGSGKSVCINSLICSVLYTKTPKQVRMILVDPKMVELSVYNDIPHLLTPVITEPKKAIKVMAFIVEEMERRMSMFKQVGAKKIEDYNQKILEKGFLRAQLPYIMVVVDEFADLMTVVGKELESYIKRITAVARFTGIHLVLATQRPSADVITGIIKSNMPTQIAFAVSNQLNSRIILDSLGAEKLLGRGDMLYASASNRNPQRIQGAFIDSEIESIVKFVKTQGQPDYIDESYFEDEDDSSPDETGTVLQGSDDLFTKAWKIVADRGEASASYLQRRLSIGYNKAANLIEQMEEAGYIGPARGSKPREILVYPDSKSEG